MATLHHTQGLEGYCVGKSQQVQYLNPVDSKPVGCQTSYVVCDNRQPKVMNCGTNTVFSPVAKSCVTAPPACQALINPPPPPPAPEVPVIMPVGVDPVADAPVPAPKAVVPTKTTPGAKTTVPTKATPPPPPPAPATPTSTARPVPILTAPTTDIAEPATGANQVTTESFSYMHLNHLLYFRLCLTTLPPCARVLVPPPQPPRAPCPP